MIYNVIHSLVILTEKLAFFKRQLEEFIASLIHYYAAKKFHSAFAYGDIIF